jgi:isoaspartyl peptidase/L-asparaginase-like protein (Ntn-hydrolase superfamily)
LLVLVYLQLIAGSVLEADANVSITGIGLEIAQGQAELDAVTFAVLTGQQLEIALNSVVQQVLLRKYLLQEIN